MGILDYDLDFSKEIPPNKMIECKCPRCERIYKKKVAWVGNGMPRKICEKCKVFHEKSFLRMKVYEE